MQCHGVTNEIDCVLFQAELFVDFQDGFIWVLVLEGLGILLVELVHPDDKASEASLFEEAHQARGQSLASICWYLVDLAALVNVAALDALELQVAGDTGVDQQLHQQTIRHQKLWDQIDVPVSASTQMGSWFANIVFGK